MMNKVTMRNTAAEIVNYLTESIATVKKSGNKQFLKKLVDLNKQFSDGKKVPKKDLLVLADECFAICAAAESKTEAKPKRESSLKKKSTAKSEATEKAEEPKKQTKSKKSAEKPKAEPKQKKEAPKKEQKKAEAKPKGFQFPTEFKDEDEVTYTKADDIKNLDDLRASIENGDNIVFAVQWTEAMLATGQYANEQLPKKLMPKRFENDLDLMQVIYVADNIDNITTVSLFTEAFYWWKAADLKQTKVGRKGANLLFELYRSEEPEE